jgi:hypothetical protein
MITLKGGKMWLDERGVRDAVRQASVDPLFKCGESVRATAIRSMKGGRKAPSEGEDPERVPSAPGSPPNRQDAILANSIQVEKDKGGRIVRIGPTVIYGRIHEFGGVIPVTPKMRGFLAWKYGWHVKTDKIVMPKRPFMRPALISASRSFPPKFRHLKLASTRAGRRLNSRKG